MASGVPSPGPAQTGLFSSPLKLSIICCLLLVAATLALYNPVAHFDFVNFDDDRYITSNPHLQAGLNWETVTWAFRSTQEANWHPLTWLSHALDCQIFHRNASGPHLINVLFQSLNAVLLFLLLYRATRQAGRSFLVAALWTLHPLNVESVAWISERKSLLSTALFFLAIAAYGYYVRKPSLQRYAAIIVAFVLALMAKPAVITLPCCLLVLDYWPLRRIGAHADPPSRRPLRALVLEKLPLFLLSAASAVVTLYAQNTGGAVKTFTDYPFESRVANALVSYIAYLGKALWPAKLAAFYPFSASLPWYEVLGAATVLIAITAFVARRPREPYLLAGWLWFLGTFAPMIGIVQVGGQAMADRYAYLPMLGILMMCVWGLSDVLQSRRVPHSAMTLIACAVLAALAFVARAQIGTWESSFTLWSHALAVTRNNFVAEDNLGNSLVSQGRYDEALPHFQRATLINPKDPLSQLNLGAYLQQHGDPQAALEHTRKVLQLTSDPALLTNALVNLGSTYRSLGNQTEARASYETALRLSPNDPSALVGLGIVEYEAGNFARAANDYYRAMLQQPTDVGYLLMSRALNRAGQQAPAQAARAQAEQISKDLAQAQESADRLLAP